MFVRMLIALVCATATFSLRNGVTDSFYRRQQHRPTFDIDNMPGPTPPSTLSTQSLEDLLKSMDGNSSDGAADSANRFSIVQTVTTHKRRTTPLRVSLEEDCDYLAYYCLKAYKTGRICGRTIYYNYQNFSNYCMLDYVNCMERYEVWQIVHMGDCFEIDVIWDYQHYEYHDDFFLDQVYVIQE